MVESVNISVLTGEEALQAILEDGTAATVAGQIAQSIQAVNARLDPYSVLAGVRDRRFLLLRAIEDGRCLASGTLEEVGTLEGRVHSLQHLAGENSGKWLRPLMQELKKIARAREVDFFEVRGRKGWLRKLEKFGFRPAYMAIRADWSTIDGV